MSAFQTMEELGGPLASSGSGAPMFDKTLRFAFSNPAQARLKTEVATLGRQIELWRVVSSGHDISLDRLNASRQLGYLPENGPLYADMTPLEALQFFGEARDMAADFLNNRIHTVTKQCALQEVLEKAIGKLSKGYRQRVGMAQALLHDPEVLILDEPTSGLDPLQIREVRALIRELGREETILLSTHILQEVEAVADEVVVIREGRVVFTGTVGALKGDESLENRFYELMEAKKEVA